MKRTVSVLTVLAAFVLFGACGSGKDAAGISQGTTKKNSITIAVGSDPATFELFSAASMLEGQIGNNIYDNLLFFDDEGNIKPYLAERWEVSGNGLEYTFWLRKGVKFHNGEELKADDVAFTVEFGKNTPNGGDICGIIGETEIIDDYTILLTLSGPYASFVPEFCGDQFPIYNRRAVTEAAANGGTYGAHPIGTGSYKFLSRDTGVEIKFEAFADHFQGAPSIQYLTYRVIPDDFTAGVALENGEVDFIWTVGSPATVESLRNNSNLTVVLGPSNRVNFISANNEKPPFNNVKLRQAINYAVDREALIDIVYEGNAEVKDYMAFPWMAGFAEPSVRYTYDLAKATALAKEAGVSKENPLNVTMILTTAAVKIGETLQQQFAEIGVNLTLDLMEFNSWITDYYGGNYEIGAGGFYMVYKDMNLIYYFYHSSSIDNNNSARYRNARVDQLFQAGRLETDPAKRAVYYKEAQDIIQTEAPYVVYANPANVRAYNKNLRIAASYANNIFIRDVSWN
jgi:peptide/nickel transport system substrate-binding protein